MDRASQIAQEACRWAREQAMMSEPPAPMAYEAAFAEKLREYFPQTRRKARKAQVQRKQS